MASRWPLSFLPALRFPSSVIRHRNVCAPPCVVILLLSAKHFFRKGGGALLLEPSSFFEHLGSFPILVIRLESGINWVIDSAVWGLCWWDQTHRLAVRCYFFFLCLLGAGGSLWDYRPVPESTILSAYNKAVFLNFAFDFNCSQAWNERMRVPFQMSAHSKSFKLYLDEERQINNENKQAFGIGLPPPPFFVKWNPFPNRDEGKNTRENMLRKALAQLVLLVYTDLNKVKSKLCT